jgi:putative ABC transport system substrate-binding protein
MRRREFLGIAFAGGAAAWPLAANAQQPARMPVVAFIFGGSSDAFAQYATSFRKGLEETGHAEHQNVSVEYYWLEGRNDRLPALISELVTREVAVIATPASHPAALAAKAATKNIPIVFGVGDDPVKLGLVTSLAQPGGNATGINFFNTEVIAKRLRLLHELVPKAQRIAVLLNPSNTTIAASTLQQVKEAARVIGVEIQPLNASTIEEIDAAFASIAREHLDALFVAPDGFFNSRPAQIATLAAVNKIPAAYASRDAVVAGGLMSYGADFSDVFHQVGVYTGNILNGAKPAWLPVVQTTKFYFVINMNTARALGIQVPPGVVSIADEVIE